MHKVIAAPFTDTYVIVRIFVKCRTVIFGKSIVIYSKVYRHKIKYCTDFVTVKFIYHIHKVFGGAVSACRGKESGILVTPAFIAWMLADWKKLDVIVSVFLKIRNE